MANSSGVGFLYFTTAGWTPEGIGLFPKTPIDRQLVPTPLHQLTLDVLIIVSDIPLHTLAKSLGWFATASGSRPNACLLYHWRHCTIFNPKKKIIDITSKTGDLPF